MKQPANEKETPPHIEFQVEKDQLRILLQNGVSGGVSSMAVAVALTLLLSNFIETSILAVWLSSISILSISRILFCKFYNFPREADQSATKRCSNIYLAIIFLSALTWGLAGFFLFSADSIIAQAYLVIIIAGTCAGSMATLAALEPFLSIFCVSACLPLSVRFALVADPGHMIIACLFIVFMFLIIGAGRKYNNSINSSLKLGYDKQELVAQLQKTLAKVEEANVLQREFLANMSHEIRTPMNAIIGFTELALKTELSSGQKELLTDVKHAGDSLLGLINDILDMSKIEAGKLEIEEIEFNLHETLTNTINMNRGKTIEKGLALNCSLPRTHTNFFGDPHRLQQVITNLIGNAVKFTKQGEVNVRVTVLDPKSPPYGDRCNLEFSVHDTGIGIPVDRQKSIFEAFTQADGATTRRYGGTGLGLSISNQLITLMGGTSIKVESEEGEGSRFFFSLPLKVGSKITEKIAAATDTKRAEREIKPSKVLLVEDNLVNVKLASRIMEAHGHKITVAENGQLALEEFRNNQFDFILMDMQMPVMGGIEATKAIRDHESHDKGKTPIPIIAMTANAMKGDRERCLEAGMNGYTTKPIKAKILFQEIKRVLDCAK